MLYGRDMAKLGWTLALLPLWGPIVILCLAAVAAVVMVSPVVGIVLGLILAIAVIDRIEKRRR